MKRKVFLITLSFLVFLGFNSLVRGAGFLIYEHGAAAMAMGGAFVAIANNPTAVFHNPAGIAWLDGTQISLGTTMIMPKSSLSLPNWPDPRFQTVDVKKQTFYPSTFYITHKISDKIVAGFGFFSPYGLGTEWPADYPLKYLSTKDDMKTFVFNPVIAYKVSDKFSLGVGAFYVRSTIEFNLVQVPDLSPVTTNRYDVPTSITDGKGSGWGWNVGALYKTEKVSFGFNWRSGFKIDFTGNIKLDRSNVPNTPITPSLTLRDLVPTGGSVATSFNFPHILCAGVAFNLTPKLLLSADVNYVLWNTYDKFVITIDFPGYPPQEPKTFEEDWKNSFLFRAGLQYQLTEKLALRGGFLYDQTPQPTDTVDPILPDADRVAFTAGFGYKVGKFVIDIAGQYEIFSDRTSPNRPETLTLYQVGGRNLGEGTYSTKALLIGISLGFVF